MIFYFVYTHITAAFLSLALLIIRSLMQLNGKDWRAMKLLKILPHLSDTLLIVSGAVLFIAIRAPLTYWLIIKIICLFLYVFFAIKFFTKKSSQANPLAALGAIVSLSMAIFVGYFH